MNRIIILLVLLFSMVLSPVQEALAFWIWTPETNKWVNPKFSVKETPTEQLTYALEFYNSGEIKEARLEFEKLLKNYPRSEEAPEAQFYIGKILEEDGAYFEAFKEYQEVIDRYPFSELSGEILKIQYEIGNKLLKGEDEKNKFIKAIKGDNLEIIDVFRAVIKNAPYGELAPPSQYKIGLYLMEKKLYQEARDEFDKVINDYPESEWTKAAKYQIAQSDSFRSTGSQYDQKITQAAVEEFKEFVEHYPDANLSEQAKTQIQELRNKEAENNFLIAQFYEKQKRYSSAKIYYKNVVNNYSDSSWVKPAMERIQVISDRE